MKGGDKVLKVSALLEAAEWVLQRQQQVTVGLALVLPLGPRERVPPVGNHSRWHQWQSEDMQEVAPSSVGRHARHILLGPADIELDKVLTRMCGACLRGVVVEPLRDGVCVGQL